MIEELAGLSDNFIFQIFDFLPLADLENLSDTNENFRQKIKHYLKEDYLGRLSIKDLYHKSRENSRWELIIKHYLSRISETNRGTAETYFQIYVYFGPETMVNGHSEVGYMLIDILENSLYSRPPHLQILKQKLNPGTHIKEFEQVLYELTKFTDIYIQTDLNNPFPHIRGNFEVYELDGRYFFYFQVGENEKVLDIQYVSMTRGVPLILYPEP